MTAGSALTSHGAVEVVGFSTFFDLDVDWSERHFELAKSLYLSDHCIFRSKEKKMRRAFFLANNILTQYHALTTASLEYLKKK